MRNALGSGRPLLVLLLLFMILGGVYNLTTPIFEAPDEVWHFAYVRYLAHNGRLPVQGAGQGEEGAQQEASQPPLYYMLAAPLIGWIVTDDFDSVARFNPHAAPGLPHSDGNKNMIVPQPATFPWRGTVLAVHSVRLFSLFLGLLTVLSAYAVGCRAFVSSSIILPLLLAGVVAFNPQFLFISSSVNNDNLMTALASLAFALIISMATERPSQRRVVLLGVATGLAAISKLTGVLLLGFVLIALALIAWQRRNGVSVHSSSSLRWFVTSAGIVVVCTVLIAGWWYMRNWLLYRDVTGLQPMLEWVGQRSLTPNQVLAELEGLELSFWAVFGWFNILVDNWIYTSLKLAVRLAALGLLLLVVQAIARLLVRDRHNRQRQASVVSSTPVKPFVLLLAALWVAIVIAGLVRWTATTPGTQGRLLFPAITAIATLLVAGLAALTPRRWSAIVPAFFVTGLFILAAIVPFAYTAPTYARPSVVGEVQAAQHHPVHMRYGDDELELISYAVNSESVHPSDTVTVTLYLQALRPMSQNYSLFVHLWGRSMEWLGQRDSYPGRGSLPTSQMTPEVIIEDRYLVTVAPTATTPARLQLEVGFYDFVSGRRLWATAPDGGRTEIPMVGRMKLSPAEPAHIQSPQPFAFSFGNQVNLLSAQMKTPPVVQAGSVITVTTTWQATSAMAQDYTIFLQVVDQQPNVITQKDGQPQDGEYPTSLWEIGEVVSDTRTLKLPAVLASGRYRIVTGIYLLATGERLAVNGPAGPIPENWAVIGEITVP